MNNVIISIKRFLKNKNTVTIIGVLLIMGVLYWGYNSQIKDATQEISIPIASQTIQPRTEITKDMIEYVKIPKIAVKNNVVRSIASIVGKYSNVNTVIPEGSMFYTNVLVDKKDLPDASIVALKEGEIIFQLPVNIKTTYGNSITPDSMIDIYMKAVDDDKKIMVAKLLQNVKVLAVKDSQGRNVFEDTEENRTPAYLIFGVPEDIHILLQKATRMGSGVELFPVPQGGVGVHEGEIQVSTQYLKDYINSHTVVIEDPNSSLDDDTTLDDGNGED